MSYPDLPKNRLIVDGVDLTAKYGLILMDGYTLQPPAPKVYTVDIPGGDGVVDVTDALTGGPVYENRTQEFSFAVISNEFEKVKSEISRFLHGKAYDYKMTMDPDYTYHGRFTITSYTSTSYSIGNVGVINVSISADPYKSKGEQTQVYSIKNGALVYPVSGLKTVQPRFEFSDTTTVIFGDKRITMPKGTYKIEDIWFTEGTNEIFMMPQNTKSLITYGEMGKHSYKDVKNNRRVYKWYQGITKYSVDTILLKPSSSTSSEIVLDKLTFTATDANGDSVTSTVESQNGFTIRTNGTVYDYIEINGNTVRYVQKLYVKDGSYVEDICPTVLTYTFKELFSNDAEIVSLSSNFTGSVTYTTSQLNTSPSYRQSTYGDYKNNGTVPMKYSDMKKCRITQLSKVDENKISVSQDNDELVYINYDWRDL